MIAKRLGLKCVVAATGAGQHGVATAAACAKLSLECTVFMGTTDMEKQSSNVLLMRLLGAQVYIVLWSISCLINMFQDPRQKAWMAFVKQ